MHRRRQAAHAARGPYKVVLTGDSLLQKALYERSAVWERQEQSTCLVSAAAYRPTQDDMLVRYIKLLIAKTLDRFLSYTIAALGCNLYHSQTSDFRGLDLTAFTDTNIRRDQGTVLQWIDERFPAPLVEVES